MGGAIFVQGGGGLTIAGPFVIDGNSVAGGLGGIGGAAQDPSLAGNGGNGAAGSAFGTGIFLQGNGTAVFQPDGGQIVTIADGIADQTGSGGTGGNAGSWNLAINGPGTLVLAGNNTYTGNTTVNAGTLDVTGSIALSSLTTVNAGAALRGSGTVGNLQINSGGVFAPGTAGAPGTSMTVAGNLAFASASFYLVQISPSASTFANVIGTASLAGTVLAVFNPAAYMSKQYEILQSAGFGGTTFSGLTTINLPAGFTASLSYNAADTIAYLSLTGALSSVAGQNINQNNVATALDNFFNNGGALPPNFSALFGLTGNALANTLTQISGEAATDAEKGAFQLMTNFLDLMLDPFVGGRSGTFGGGTALGFAPEQKASFPPDIALAYAGVLKAPPKPAVDQRWSAWGSAFGGTNTTNGDPIVGSNNVTATDFGFAAGMDYHFTRDTTAGFALAGGGTNWNLAQGLGGGRSDAFQAGVYGASRAGPSYLAVALAVANHWMTTNRIALGDQLTAKFDGQSYGGRLEAGYRYSALPTVGVTPYAAVQAQSFHTPSYSETDLTGGGFGLSYGAMTGTDTRGELGARFDDLTTLAGKPLVLRARVAWAHDWVSNPALGAVFQALPGASFTVNGAAPPQNSALASASAEMRLTVNWSLAAKFAGEFASGSQTYSGTGTLRYTW
jgi:autotransporter-associated beta strand protein